MKADECPRTPSPLKCDECEKTSTAYKLSFGGIYPMTDMAFCPFVDDEGKRHYHDGNSGGGEFWRCTNGHYVNEEKRPSCWCGWPISGAWAKDD